ncbi:hypothetical protein FNV43_RR02304 [Rhamnella rubrinervis]|uniref:F-box domain-containing protein n=1 Tax=Rhamnella rubrinervis TaxID=2594499 RepID=A0A8K0HS32_9ROSA|nr:hypothetical protein FNV43_RR02304 [Rhamnella rubrinervis]
MEGGSLELGIWDLPHDCISHIFSLTSPRDVCRCSAVSSVFRSAAESDAVWERFLPPNWEEIISKSVSPVEEFSSLRAVYFHLCDSPILVDGQGKKNFALVKENGKIYYMVAPEDLSMRLVCVPTVWEGIFPMPYAYECDKSVISRFSEVYDVDDGSSSWLQIHGRIQMQFLSPNTTYAAYLVYVPRRAIVFNHWPVLKVAIKFVSNGGEENKIEVVSNEGVYRGCDRIDKWMEVEVGEFFNGGQDDVEVEVEMRLWEIREYGFVCPSGLDLQGIEIRPKEK